jgi:hypothetical protein
MLVVVCRVVLYTALLLVVMVALAIAWMAVGGANWCAPLVVCL